jgi:hypothetical protein
MADKAPNASKLMGNAAKAGNVATNAAKAGNAATNAATKNDKLPMIIIVVVTILLFLFVILYISYAMKSSNLKGKALMTAPIRVDKSDTPIQISNGDIPKPMVGREFTYAFWMYVENFTPEVSSTAAPMHKVVLFRGNVGSGASANPLILLDGQSNKLHIIIKTTESSIQSTTVNANLDEILKNNYFISNKSIEDPTTNKHLILTIDYIPIQRWVNVAFVVDNKIVTVYLDGEIYSVKSTDEFKSARQPQVSRLGKTLNYNLIIEKTDGDVFIGKTVVGAKRTFNGWMGKLEFFNYALTMDQVKKVYQTGPMPRGLLAMLGLGQYGFRAPVYKLNQSVQ